MDEIKVQFDCRNDTSICTKGSKRVKIKKSNRVKNIKYNVVLCRNHLEQICPHDYF